MRRLLSIIALYAFHIGFVRPVLRWVLLPALTLGLASLTAVMRRRARPLRALLPAAGALALVLILVGWRLAEIPAAVAVDADAWLVFPCAAAVLLYVLWRPVVGSRAEVTT